MRKLHAILRRRAAYILKRLQTTAQKAGVRANKIISSHRTGSPSASIHDKYAVEQEATKTTPCSATVYFDRGHAQRPYYSTSAFRWYRRHIMMDRMSDGKTPTIIPDSGDEQLPKGTPDGKKESRSEKRKRKAQEAKGGQPSAQNPHASPLIDNTGSQEAWRTAIAKIPAAHFKDACIKWFMHQTGCQREQVQCPYFVFTDFPMCPPTEVCGKRGKYGFQHCSDDFPAQLLAQVKTWLVSYFRDNNGLPVDILTRLRKWCSTALQQASLLPATYAQSLPRSTSAKYNRAPTKRDRHARGQ